MHRRRVAVHVIRRCLASSRAYPVLRHCPHTAQRGSPAFLRHGDSNIREVIHVQRRSMASGLPPHDAVPMPALSPTMETGTVSEWKVQEGEAFQPGDVICLVETDKATVDFEAQDEGYLAKILIPAGEPNVAVGTPMMITVEDSGDVAAFASYIHGDGEAAAAAPSEAPAPEPTPMPAATQAAPTPPAAAAASATTATDGRIFASPKAKVMAAAEGYNLADITGTGPNGRIIAADVLEFVPQAAAEGVVAPQQPQGGAPAPLVTQHADFADIAVSADSQAMAMRMTAAKQAVPHYYLTVDLKLDGLLSLMSALNEDLPESSQLTLHEILLKAAAQAVKKVPDVNATWMETHVRQYSDVDINIICGVGDGLVAPLVSDVASRGLKSIGDEVKAHATAASEGLPRTHPHCDYPGTFTVMNLGMYGVKSFAPIVNSPQACMLAIGAAEERVLPSEDPESEDIYQVNTCLTATLSCDHRVVNGAVGATWLQAFKAIVEQPVRMLL
ncbi:unnamed protein product [Chrysoparadoxa australica]